MAPDPALASQILSAIGDWACGDGTPTTGALPYRDVTRALFEGLAWLQDPQPDDAMVTRAGIETCQPVGPDVILGVFFDLEPEGGVFYARVYFVRRSDGRPVPRITDHETARLTASLNLITAPVDVTRPPYMPGNRADLVAYGTRLPFGGSLAAAYQRCVDADTSDRPYMARAYRGRPDNRAAAVAAMRRLRVPDGWTIQPSLTWADGGQR